MLFRQMEYLQAVVECGSFYAAAEKCHVSQSAISQQIKKLEDELGVQLLDRHNRTFSLTNAGDIFTARASLSAATWGSSSGKPSGWTRMTAAPFAWAATRATTAANFHRPLRSFPKNIPRSMCR